LLVPALWWYGKNTNIKERDSSGTSSDIVADEEDDEFDKGSPDQEVILEEDTEKNGKDV
jgi:hypothetical protein